MLDTMAMPLDNIEAEDDDMTSAAEASAAAAAREAAATSKREAEEEANAAANEGREPRYPTITTTTRSRCNSKQVVAVRSVVLLSAALTRTVALLLLWL
tara:strand:- start:162 stop:458 length:297 start_codon:yes stop_codon:yes gene_type:complete